MTTLEVYEHVLTELNKVEAPSLLLEDFNYFLNKAIYQKKNKDYNFDEMNQQLLDSLLPLYKTATLVKDTPTGYYKLPTDYMHIKSCGIKFNTGNIDCDSNIIYSTVGAIRLSADKLHQIQSNYYMKPSIKRPYYVLHSSSTGPLLEIKCGTATITSVDLEYIKLPVKLQLTNAQIDGATPETLEFAEYVCYEIINEMVMLILENSSDPRLQSHLPINQTIAPPIGSAK